MRAWRCAFHAMFCLVDCTRGVWRGRGFVFFDYWVREGEVLPAWAFGLRVTLLNNLPTNQLINRQLFFRCSVCLWNCLGCLSLGSWVDRGCMFI
jgi:hypothetical protein